MSTREILCDAVVIGGGVTGLWVRHALGAAGYSTVMLERGPAGAGQTAASQGILHAGFKYAMTESSQRIADDLRRCGEAWEAALAGRAGPDLRKVEIRTESMYFWAEGLIDRLAATAAASVLHSGVRALSRAEFPTGFLRAPPGVHVWRVDEKVIDPTSLARELMSTPGGPIASPACVEEIGREAGFVNCREEGGGRFVVRAKRLVLAAGEGNGDLLRSSGIDPAPIMQIRPLHQVFVRPAPFVLFAHRLHASPKPRITVTTSTSSNGELVWYVGGDLAESGVHRSEDEQVQFARSELATCVPWVDFRGRKFAAFRVNRAEAYCEGKRRPDGPELRSFDRVLAVWPTKLAMAPAAAAAVLSDFRAAGVLPSRAGLGSIGEPTPAVCLAGAPCDAPDLRWF